MDDEAAICRLASRVIGTHHEVSIAENLGQAAEIFAQGGFELALVDQNLPDGDGMEFLRRIQAESPDTYRVIMSGNPRRPGEDDAFHAPLNKPFGLADLRAVLAEAEAKLS